MGKRDPKIEPPQMRIGRSDEENDNSFVRNDDSSEYDPTEVTFMSKK